MRTKMGKSLMVVLSVLAAIVIGMVTMAIADHTDTWSYRQPDHPSALRKIQWMKIAIDNDWPDTNLDDASFALPRWNGLVTRIVYDSTGTDTSWSLILKDSIGVAIFTKTDCTSGDEPKGHMIYEDDTEGNPWLGVPIWGRMTLDIDDVGRQDEVQTCDANTNGDYGKYSITIDGETTGWIAYNANTAAIVTALEALDNIGESGMTSVVSTLDAGADTAIVLTFADTLGNIPMVTFDVNDTNAVSVTVTETTEGGNLLTALDIYIILEQ